MRGVAARPASAEATLRRLAADYARSEAMHIPAAEQLRSFQTFQRVVGPRRPRSVVRTALIVSHALRAIQFRFSFFSNILNHCRNNRIFPTVICLTSVQFGPSPDIHADQLPLTADFQQIFPHRRLKKHIPSIVFGSNLACPHSQQTFSSSLRQFLGRVLAAGRQVQFHEGQIISMAD
jgi:hypothetical protein